MEISLSKLIATIINFTVLIVIVGGIAKFFKSTNKVSKSNSDIEKKLDKIVELLENKQKRE